MGRGISVSNLPSSGTGLAQPSPFRECFSRFLHVPRTTTRDGTKNMMTPTIDLISPVPDPNKPDRQDLITKGEWVPRQCSPKAGTKQPQHTIPALFQSWVPPPGQMPFNRIGTPCAAPRQVSTMSGGSAQGRGVTHQLDSTPHQSINQSILPQIAVPLSPLLRLVFVVFVLVHLPLPNCLPVLPCLYPPSPGDELAP